MNDHITWNAPILNEGVVRTYRIAAHVTDCAVFAGIVRSVTSVLDQPGTLFWTTVYQEQP